MSKPGTVETRQFHERELAPAAAALTRGFDDDPLSNYMIPDPAKRAACLPAHFATVLRMGHLFGEVYVCGSPPAGAAIWFRPGQWELSEEQLHRSGAFELEQILPAGAFERFLAVEAHIERIHREDLPFPHWYLGVLGVDRAGQGQGIGSALLQPILRKADEQGLPCYLETAEASNLPFYERHGFEVRRDETEPASRLHLWTMLRPAGAPTLSGGQRRA